MSYSSESMYDVIDKIVDESNVAEEASFFAGNGIDGFNKNYEVGVHKASFNEIRIFYKRFKNEWKAIRTLYSRSELSRNLDLQKTVLWKEKHLIQEALEILDGFEENAFANILTFSGMLSITVFLSASVLVLPESAPTAVMATAVVGKCIGDFYLTLKLMGMMVKYSDNTASVLRSQKATGVLSKQMLTAKLRHQMINIDKKLQAVLAQKLLDTNPSSLRALQRYNERYLDRFMENASKMQEDLPDIMMQSTQKYFAGGKNNDSRFKTDVNDPANSHGNPKVPGKNGWYTITGKWKEDTNPKQIPGQTGFHDNNSNWHWYGPDRTKNLNNKW